MKNYFPIRKTNKLSKQILIQPMFVDQRLKSPKKIKGLGENYSWSQNTILRSVEKDLKKGIRNFLLFIVPKEKQKLPEDFSFHYEVIHSLKNNFKNNPKFQRLTAHAAHPGRNKTVWLYSSTACSRSP